MDGEQIKELAEHLFELIGQELVAASRNARLGEVEGFVRLASDTARFARFEGSTSSTTEAICCSETSDRSRLFVSRFPVSVPCSITCTHVATLGSSLLSALIDTEATSAGWSPALPTPLPTPAFLPVGSRVVLRQHEELAVLEIVIDDDDAVVDALRSACEWLDRFAPAALSTKARPWRAHHLDAARAALLNWATERVKLERDLAAATARVAELGTRAEALRRSGNDAAVRRTLESRILARREAESLGARVALLREQVVTTKRTLGV